MNHSFYPMYSYVDFNTTNNFILNPIDKLETKDEAIRIKNKANKETLDFSSEAIQEAEVVDEEYVSNGTPEMAFEPAEEVASSKPGF